MLANVRVMAAKVTHLDVGFLNTRVSVLKQFWKKVLSFFYYSTMASSAYFFADLTEYLSLYGSFRKSKVDRPRPTPKTPMN